MAVERYWRCFASPEGTAVLGIVLALVILWVVLGVIGVVVKGLFWLLIVALVLFLITLVLGGVGLRGRRPTR
jgi:hypothetical protein